MNSIKKNSLPQPKYRTGDVVFLPYFSSPPGNGWVRSKTGLSYTDTESSNISDIKKINDAAKRAVWISAPLAGSTADAYYFYASAYGNGLWALGGRSYGVYGAVLRFSTDAITWVSKNSSGGSNFGVYNTINSIDYGNGLWALAAYYPNNTVRISTDTTNWTVSSTEASILRCIRYANNIWVLTGDNGLLKTSTDAVNWVTQNSNVNTTLSVSKVGYGGGKWVAIGNDYGTVRTSTDAVTWTTVNVFAWATIAGDKGTGFWDIAYGNGTWLVATTNYCLYSSTDGTNWSPPFYPEPQNSIDSDFAQITQIAYDSGKSLWCANWGNTFIISTDTVTWVRDSPQISSDLNSLIGANGSFLAANGSFLCTMLRPANPQPYSVAPEIAAPPGYIAWIKS